MSCKNFDIRGSRGRFQFWREFSDGISVDIMCIKHPAFDSLARTERAADLANPGDLGVCVGCGVPRLAIRDGVATLINCCLLVTYLKKRIIEGSSCSQSGSFPNSIESRLFITDFADFAAAIELAMLFNLRFKPACPY